MFVWCECLCCQAEVSGSGRSLVQRSHTKCGVSTDCDREAPSMETMDPDSDRSDTGGKKLFLCIGTA